MRAGLICPVGNEQKLYERLEQINKEGITQDIAENGKQAIIRRELFNYEYFYTGDICDCVKNLKITVTATTTFIESIATFSEPKVCIKHKQKRLDICTNKYQGMFTTTNRGVK